MVLKILICIQGGKKMARRRLSHYVRGPKTEEAKALAKKVFELNMRRIIHYF